MYLGKRLLVVDFQIICQILEQRRCVYIILEHELQGFIERKQEHAEQALSVYHTAFAMNPNIVRILGDNSVDLLDVICILYANSSGNIIYLLVSVFRKIFFLRSL